MNDTLQNILFVAPILLFSVIAHEYAHGYAALKQGDTTALQLGRLTWNPVKHIDPFLTILMPLMMGLASNWRVMLGGAKPVPVNPSNYRNLKRGDIIVSLAGVFTNLLIALGCTALIALFGFVGRAAPGLQESVSILQVMMIYGVMINLMLIMFNLLPLPPLDGSHVMKYLMPASWAVHYQRIGRYGIVVLILMLSVGRGLLDAWMRPAWVTAGALLGAVRTFVLPRALELYQ